MFEKYQILRIVDSFFQVSLLQKKLTSEQHSRQQLEDTFLRKDDEMGKLRSSFDRSLNTINGDARNLKTILDKSLHKLDRHIMATQGLAPTDSEITSADESIEASRARSKWSMSYSPIKTKLDKYLPQREERLANETSRRSVPVRKLSPERKASPSRKTKQTNLNGKVNGITYASPKIKSDSAHRSQSARRPVRPGRS